MAKTLSIGFECTEIQITPVNGRVISVNAVDVDPHVILEEIPLDTVNEFVQRNSSPEDVFTESELEKWAEANGYTKS